MSDPCYIADRLDYFTIGLTDIKPGNVLSGVWITTVLGPLDSVFLNCSTHGQLGKGQTIDLPCALPFPRGRYLFVAAKSGYSQNYELVLQEVEVYDGKLILKYVLCIRVQWQSLFI